jgi:hypothetical protein
MSDLNTVASMKHKLIPKNLLAFLDPIFREAAREVGFLLPIFC